LRKCGQVLLSRLQPVDIIPAISNWKRPVNALTIWFQDVVLHRAQTFAPSRGGQVAEQSYSSGLPFAVPFRWGILAAMGGYLYYDSSDVAGRSSLIA
jgi:hypothetical protein